MVHTFVQSQLDDILNLAGELFGVELMATTTTSTGATKALIGATPLQGVVFTLLMSVLVVGISELTWRFVELPGQR